MLAVLTRAIEERDPYARGHSARVTALAEAVALRLGWTEQRLEGLRIGGVLHDVGKLAVDEAVLLKRGPLNEAELRQIRAHPIAGAKLIVRIEWARAGLPYILYHHERWDGAGYPSGKTGTEIPLEARILSVADAFDAMTSTRPYRRALSPEQALAELDRCAGTQFDPELAREFLDVWLSGSGLRAVG